MEKYLTKSFLLTQLFNFIIVFVLEYFNQFNLLSYLFGMILISISCNLIRKERSKGDQCEKIIIVLIYVFIFISNL